MTQTWQIKRYYKPRITLPIECATASELPDGLYYLTGPQLGIIRTFLQYAHRRISWVQEYHETHYVVPAQEEWDIIEAAIAELENTLMTSCCEDLVAQLEAIAGAQADIAGTLVTMEETIQDLIPPLECLCASEETQQVNVVVAPNWVDYPSAEDVFDWSTTNPVTTIAAQGDTNACELAQAWYQCGFEWMTEVVLPAFRFGFDKLIPAAAAALAYWTGGVALPVAIGVYALAELIQELFSLGYNGAEANLENWLYTHKQDIVCPLYDALKAGGTGPAIWGPIQADLVDPSNDISAGDKLLINVVFRYWALSGANTAKAQASEWYQSIQTPGYCASCPAPPAYFEWNWPPCPGSGWYGTGVCWNDMYCFNHSKYANYETTLEAPPSGSWNKATYHFQWYSSRSAPTGVGEFRPMYWNGSSWQPIHSGVGFQNQVTAGSLNTLEVVRTGFSEPGGRAVLFQIYGPGGQYESEPYPLECVHIDVQYEQV